MSSSHVVVASFEIPLSHPWEYRRAGIKKPERRAHRAALRVVVWPTLKRYRKGAGPVGPKSAASAWDVSDSKLTGAYGPIVAEIHLVVGWTQPSTAAHEVIHAVGFLPKKAGRPHHKGKLGEVAAYRVDRIIQTLGAELGDLGLSFTERLEPKPLKIAKGGCWHPSCLVEIASRTE